MSRLLSWAAVTPLNDLDSGQPVLSRDAQKPKSVARLSWASVGALGGIRTPNLLIRSRKKGVRGRPPLSGTRPLTCGNVTKVQVTAWLKRALWTYCC